MKNYKRYVEKPSREVLEEAYTSSSIASLSKQFNTSRPTVRAWLKSYNIPIRDHKTECLRIASTKAPEIPSRETILQLYEEQKHSISYLKDHFGVKRSVLKDWLQTYNIPQRSQAQSVKDALTKKYEHLQFSRELLESYNDRKMSIHEIASELNCSRSHIRELFIEHGILSKYEGKKDSRAEIDLFYFCHENLPGTWKRKDRSIIYPLELDIVCDELKIAIEYCGIYWHSELMGKDRSYHADKRRACEEAGYSLVTVFETDPIEKVHAHLRHRAGIVSNKVGARECEVREVGRAEAVEFHEKYHMHGYVGSSIHWGLYHEGELVQLASFGKSRFNRKYELECTRCTVKSDWSIAGGTSKLFSKVKSSLITYVDFRYGDGRSYEAAGMTRLKPSGPNYWYFNGECKLSSRVKFQKHKLTTMPIYDPEMTEWQIMRANGWNRIWDCGNAVFVRD